VTCPGTIAYIGELEASKISSIFSKGSPDGSPDWLSEVLYCSRLRLLFRDVKACPYDWYHDFCKYPADEKVQEFFLSGVIFRDITATLVY
jgi:hypothetical protein